MAGLHEFWGFRLALSVCVYHLEVWDESDFDLYHINYTYQRVSKMDTMK